MARPREFDKAHVIKKVEEVFWERGFEATSMNDLAEAAGMQRGSLYNAFGDKRQLYLEALTHYGEREYGGAAERLREVTETHGASAAIYSLYETLAEKVDAGQADYGCLVCNACGELSASDVQVRELAQHYTGILQKAIADNLTRDTTLKLTQAQAVALADSFTATYLGFRLWTKAGLGSAALRQSAATAMKLLES